MIASTISTRSENCGLARYTVVSTGERNLKIRKLKYRVMELGISKSRSVLVRDYYAVQDLPNWLIQHIFVLLP